VQQAGASVREGRLIWARVAVQELAREQAFGQAASTEWARASAQGSWACRSARHRRIQTRRGTSRYGTREGGAACAGSGGVHTAGGAREQGARTVQSVWLQAACVSGWREHAHGDARKLAVNAGVGRPEPSGPMGTSRQCWVQRAEQRRAPEELQ
jgi:hypothetical protein